MAEKQNSFTTSHTSNALTNLFNALEGQMALDSPCTLFQEARKELWFLKPE